MMQLNALFLVLISLTIPMALRALFGPLPFYVTFVATEATKVIIIISFIQIKVINFLSKVTHTLYAAFANFSAALQLLFVLDFRLVVMSIFRLIITSSIFRRYIIKQGRH